MKFVSYLLATILLLNCSTPKNNNTEIKINEAYYTIISKNNQNGYNISFIIESKLNYKIKEIILRKHKTHNFSNIDNKISCFIITNSNQIKPSETSNKEDGIIIKINGKEFFMKIDFVYKKI